MKIPVNLDIEIPDDEGRKLLALTSDFVGDDWQKELSEYIVRRIVGQIMMSPWYTRTYALITRREDT